MNKKMVTAGLAAGLLAGTGAGLILQMSGSAGAASSAPVTIAADDTSADDTTTETATDDAARQAERTARLQEVLQPLVDDGTLTSDQLAKVVTALETAGPSGGGHDGRGGRGGRGLATVAETLGMTEADVKDAISNGQTLAQLAEAKGLTGQALIDAILVDVQTHLDEEVASGEHTQEEADAKLAEATTRITEFVNNTGSGPVGGEGPGGRGGRGPGGRGQGGPAEDATADSGTDTGS